MASDDDSAGEDAEAVDATDTADGPSAADTADGTSEADTADEASEADTADEASAADHSSVAAEDASTASAADADDDAVEGAVEEAAEDAQGPTIQRCDYCRLPCPTTPVTLDRDGVTYKFCSESCHDALEGSDRVFTEYHGFRRLSTGVSALDNSLPQGIPRNSFVMLTDLAGTRTEALQAELVWRALQRGEPVVFMSFLEPPVSVIQEFVSLEWNVLPSIEQGNLHILDCFTYRVDDRERMQERMSTWNAHLQRVAEQSTTTVRDPSDVSQLENRLDGVLEEMDMQDRGIVVIDTLTELGSLVQPVQAYNFVKNVRADVCKGRFVPIFASATVTGDSDGFPHDLGYMVDGIVEMRLNDEMIADALVKQIRVRKMSGVLTFPEWESYEYTAGKGIVTFDPVAEMEEAQAARERREGASEGAGEGTSEDDGGAAGDEGGGGGVGDGGDESVGGTGGEAGDATADDPPADGEPADAPASDDGPAAGEQ